LSRREHAVKTDQMQARSRHQRGQALHEFQRRHLDVRGAVAPGTLELQATRAEATHSVFGYIEGWYNTTRMHSSLG